MELEVSPSRKRCGARALPDAAAFSYKLTWSARFWSACASRRFGSALSVFVFVLAVFALTATSRAAVPDPQSYYENRPGADPNGIDKYYMGRQIAHVMGHQAADWLERPTRQAEEHTDEMINLLGLKPGENVADIGAGTGYISWRMAKKIAPTGKVYAVEIQQEMLDLLGANMKDRGISNVVQTLGTIADPKLPTNALDLIIMVDVYHEFDHPYEMTDAMVRSLKAGGRLVFVEFRKEDPNVPIKELHKMSELQVKKEMAIFPLQHSQTFTNLPWQHVIVFKKMEIRPRGGVDLDHAPAVPSATPKRAKIAVQNVRANIVTLDGKSAVGNSQLK